MNCPHPFDRRPRTRALTAAFAVTAVATALLGGCLGSGNDPATAQAVPDAVVAGWNRTTTVDVLANDRASAGGVSLVGVAQAPANGSATATDGRIVYTPAAGFYGVDTLRYTMRADDGGATAVAEVRITVEAELELAGIATDAPLAGAAVRISGAASAEATAGSDGRWQARVRVSDREAVLRIEAAGTGAQQAVRLVSAAPVADVVAAADASADAAIDGAAPVDETRAGALAVTHFSSAVAALVERASGGTLPATAAAWRAAQAGVDPQAVLSLATLVHMVADRGLALPEGSADTWALLRDAGASTALLAAQTATQTAATAFHQAQASAIANAPADGSLPTVGVLVTVPLNSTIATGPMLNMAADGTAQVVDWRGTRNARWSQRDGSLVVELALPYSETAVSVQVDPQTNQQWLERRDTSALRFKRLAGGLLEVSAAVTATILDGPRAGQVSTMTSLSDPGISVGYVVDPLPAGGVLAADLEPGKRWSGLLMDRLSVTSFPARDTIEVTAPGRARALMKQRLYTFETTPEGFTLTGDDGSRIEYRPLASLRPDGARLFLATDRSDPLDVRATALFLLPPGEAMVWDRPTAARMWRLDPQPGFPPFDIALRPDGSSLYNTEAATWQIEPDGRLRVLRPRPDGRRSRLDWIALRRGADGWVWVLRTNLGEAAASPVSDASAFWLMVRVRDMGPAVPPS